MVSIIIATFNASKTLRTALNSIKKQKFQDWECIIVDGASKDNTIKIIQEYAINDSRFRYISEPDKGIYDAFNKGWKMAKGEWISYLGCDDELTADGINSLIDQCGNADIVYGNTLLRKPNRTKLKLQISSNPKMGGFCCHQSMIMKRNVISELGGFDMQYKILADKDLICRAIKINCKIQRTDAIVSIFSLGGTSSPSIKRYKESFSINKKNMSLPSAICDLFFNVLRNTCSIVTKR